MGIDGISPKGENIFFSCKYLPQTLLINITIQNIVIFLDKVQK